MWPQLYWAAVFVGSALGEGDGTARRTAQVPFVADAVGNSLPPPAELPSKVGSPSNLLTPDRYEFYTFDESGELVKRLMTLEEIQAIVAAGEGNDGHLVTFAQDDKPTIAFNFSQPPFTKVHSVVTNVQNVLKSQMEAQKNNPPKPTSFDTPDVSNSWSMILPSIFGNTGVDIIPDKLPSSFGTPETDTIDNKPSYFEQDSELNASSKEKTEDDAIIESSKNTDIKDKVKNEEQTTSKTTGSATTSPELTTRITTTSISPKTTTTTTTTTHKPTTTTSTTTAPQPSTTIITTTTAKRTSNKNSSTNTITVSSTTARITTSSQDTKNTIEFTKLANDDNFEKISSSDAGQNLATKNEEETTKKISIGLDKNSHMPPATTDISYVEITNPKVTAKPYTDTTLTTSRITTFKPISPQSPTTFSSESTTKNDLSHVSVTTYRPTSSPENPKISVTFNDNSETKNGTTLTTQSVSPSTSVPTTNITPSTNSHITQDTSENKHKIVTNNSNTTEKFENESNPAFDVAESISQIASDLGNSFVAQNNKEALEAQIKDTEDLDLHAITTTEKQMVLNSNTNFVKIPTTDPQNFKEQSSTLNDKIASSSTENVGKINATSNVEVTTEGESFILPNLMSNLLSQVVDELPNNIMQVSQESQYNKISESPLNRNDDMDIITTTISTLNSANNDSLGSKNNLTEDGLDNNKKESTITLDSETNQASQINAFTKLPTVSSTTTTASVEALRQKEEHNSSNKPAGITALNTDELAINNSTETLSKDIIETNVSKTETVTIKNNYFYETNKISKNITSSNFNKFDSMNTSYSDKGPIKSENKNSDYTIPFKNKIPLNHNQKNGTIVAANSATSANTSHKQDQKIYDSKKKVQKVNLDEKEYVEPIKNDTWKLVPTVPPPKVNEIPTSKPPKINNHFVHELANDPSKEINLEGSKENQGLEVTIKNLGEDVYQFTDLCNELAFRYWSAAVENIDKKRSFVLSPYSITSMLAMMFMGARGATSGEMNDILKLDDMVTFNPHFTLKNISDSIEITPASGVAVSAFVRELYSDRNRGKLLTFYKERAQHFYSGHVEEINFKLINDIIRRRTNLLVKRSTWGKINEYIKSNSFVMKPPLAAFSANIFATDCTGSSVEGRDGEMYFVVSPSVRQRRLVPVPAALHRGGFLAGYDPALDATAAALGGDAVVSTLYLMPGQQGNAVHGDDLERLERKLLGTIPTAPEWYRLLRTLLPRPGLELQLPRFSHSSVFNVSSALRGMGLRDIFDPAKADLGGLNGPSTDLFLSDMVQTSTFQTCGEGAVGDQHHVEEYPAAAAARRRRWAPGWEEPRDYQRAFHDPHDVGAALQLPLHLRPRQARLPTRAAPAPSAPPRLKFDRPFLYFVRHNPTGMILYVGRYNPRLLP